MLHNHYLEYLLINPERKIFLYILDTEEHNTSSSNSKVIFIYSSKPSKKFKRIIHFDSNFRSFFNLYGQRYYLDQFSPLF